MDNKKKVVELLKDIDIDISTTDLEDISTYDELTKYLEENDYFTVEIIYYASAMEYLSENDNSLRESLELAQSMGYEAGNLNSETLATIHASNKAREEYYALEDEITELLEVTE